MQTHTVHLNVPNTTGLNDEALQEYLAAKLYGDGKLSLGQAAELLGKTKWDMPEVLNKYCVPYFNYPAEDLTDDVLAINTFLRHASHSG